MNRSRAPLSVALGILLAGGAAFPPSLSASSFLPFRKEVLPNGLTVILHEDRTIPVVAIGTWIKTGAADESAGNTGRAHLFEHFMFEGSEHVAQGEFDSTIYAMGGTNNAHTAFDETYFKTLVPSNGLEAALRLEADRLGFLRRSINPAALKKQIGIVVNELREDLDGTYAQVGPESAGLLWPEGHPGRNDPGGEIPDVESTTPADAEAFHRKFYNPNNAILVIAGDIEAGEASALVRKWYGDIPRGPAPPPRAFPPFKKLQGRVAKKITSPKATRESLYLNFPIPGISDPDFDRLGVLSAVLTGNDAWGLHKALVLDANLARSVSMGTTNREKANFLRIAAAPVDGVTPERLEDAILTYIEGRFAGGLPPAALPSVKSVVGFALLSGLQDVESRAQTLAAGEAHYGNPGNLETGLAELRAMSESELVAAGRKYLTRSNMAVVVIGPEAAP